MTATPSTNTVTDNAYDVSAPGDVNATVQTSNPNAHLLINASKLEHEKLTYQGLDISAGLEVMATGLNDGTSEVNFAKSFAGHSHSIERINRDLVTYDVNFPLRKAGELMSFGFGRSRLQKVGVNPETGKDIFSGYRAAGRNVYCPMKITADGITFNPYLLWNQRWFMTSEMIYADSDHCRAQDWGYQVRQMQGLFILWMIQNDPNSGDTRAFASRRLAQTFKKDVEKGMYIYSERVKHAVKANNLESYFSL